MLAFLEIFIKMRWWINVLGRKKANLTFSEFHSFLWNIKEVMFFKKLVYILSSKQRLFNDEQLTSLDFTLLLHLENKEGKK